MARTIPPPYENLDLEIFLGLPDVQRFIGKNYEYYKNLWLGDYAKKKSVIGVANTNHLNALAMLLNVPTWLGYRKMHAYALGFTALFCLVMVGEHFLGLRVPNGVYAILNLVVALRLKGLYFDWVVRQFYKHRDTERAVFDAFLGRQGGTSVPLAIFYGLFFAAAVIGTSLALDTLIPAP